MAGAAHFAVPDARAQQLHASSCPRLPGYLVPRLVREMPAISGQNTASSRTRGHCPLPPDCAPQLTESGAANFR